MRILRFRFTIKRMLIAVAFLGVVSWVFARYERNWTYYLAGWWDAECQLWQGRATIDGGGSPVRLPFGFCYIDKETGLTIVLRVFGFQEGDRERSQGHDEHIRQYVAWNGLPRNSFKPWEKELFSLKPWFTERSRSNPPIRLIAGAPSAGLAGWPK